MNEKVAGGCGHPPRTVREAGPYDQEHRIMASACKKDPVHSAPDLLLYKENHRQCRWFPKALAIPSPAAAESLPLTREVDSPSGEAGGRETRRKIFSPPVFCFAKASPLVRGGLGRCVYNRICGSGARHTSERKPDEPIGSADKRP